MAFNQGNTKAGKLTAVEVLEIREKYATGLYTYDRLALEYGVATNTIRSIVKGTSWQQVPMVTPQHVVDDAAMRSQRRLEAMLAQADGLPAEAVEVDEATLAAMEQAVQKIPQPEFLKPDADMAARMAAYGVRPPEPKELIEALARPDEFASKPAIQAQSADECPPALGDVGGGSATVSSCQTPKCRYDAGHSGACKSEQGIYLDSRQATPGQNSSELLDQTTEEAGKL